MLLSTLYIKFIHKKVKDCSENHKIIFLSDLKSEEVSSHVQIGSMVFPQLLKNF